MTVYDQLKPEVKERLRINEFNYPTLIGILIRQLKKEEFFYGISIMDFKDLVSFGLEFEDQDYDFRIAREKLFNS